MSGNSKNPKNNVTMSGNGGIQCLENANEVDKNLKKANFYVKMSYFMIFLSAVLCLVIIF